jgi:hypothetical protein
VKTIAFWLAFFGIAFALTLGFEALVGASDEPVTCDQPVHCEDVSGSGPGNR